MNRETKKEIIDVLLCDTDSWKLYCDEVFLGVYEKPPSEVDLEDFLREFGRYTLECFQDSNYLDLRIAAERIEKLQHTDLDQVADIVKELLRSIYFDWWNNGVDPHQMQEFLGGAILKLWTENKKEWQGETDQGNV